MRLRPPPWENLRGKVVLLRVDFNVQVVNDAVSNPERLEASMSTIARLQEKGAITFLLSHKGRPKGHFEEKESLKPIYTYLHKTFLPTNRFFFCSSLQGPEIQALRRNLRPGDVVLLENLRFFPQEESNDPVFSALLASLGDLYINDAFSASHRAHASIEGVTAHLSSYAGPFLQKEISSLQHYLQSPDRPFMALVGGAKISSKLDLLHALVEKVDILAVGGAMASTFLLAQGLSVGQSLAEPALIPQAREIVHHARQRGCKFILPVDVVTSPACFSKEKSLVQDVATVGPERAIVDIGPGTVAVFKSFIEQARTLIWNGSLGLTEPHAFFGEGTEGLARLIVQQTQAGKLTSVVGGGDTAGLLSEWGLARGFSYVSLAGGAFLEWVEGKPLPGLTALERQSLKGRDN